MKSKDGHQSKTIGEKGRHPTKNFYINPSPPSWEVVESSME